MGSVSIWIRPRLVGSDSHSAALSVCVCVCPATCLSITVTLPLSSWSTSRGENIWRPLRDAAYSPQRCVTDISLAACREKVQEGDVYIIPALCQSKTHPVFDVRLSVFTELRSSVCCYPLLWTGMGFTGWTSFTIWHQCWRHWSGPEEVNVCSVLDWLLKAYGSSSMSL